MPNKDSSEPDATPYSAEMNELFRKFGFTVYIAQLFENALGLVIVAAEMNKIITVDRKALGIESVLKRTIGANLAIFDGTELFDPKTLKFLRHANHLRNNLVHFFFLENIIDTTSPTGRKAVTEKLDRIRNKLAQANGFLEGVKNDLLSKVGYDEEWARQQLGELRDAVSDYDGGISDNPYSDNPYK